MRARAEAHRGREDERKKECVTKKHGRFMFCQHQHKILRDFGEGWEVRRGKKSPTLKESSKLLIFPRAGIRESQMSHECHLRGWTRRMGIDFGLLGKVNRLMLSCLRVD